MEHIPERLEKLQQMQAAAEAIRQATDCTHDAPTVLFVWLLRSGERRVYEGCGTCRAQVGKVIAHDKADAPVSDLEVGIDERAANPPCVRCGAFGTQLHHWMPRDLVPPGEADRWPTDYLCPECHDWWHYLTGTGRYRTA